MKKLFMILLILTSSLWACGNGDHSSHDKVDHSIHLILLDIMTDSLSTQYENRDYEALQETVEDMQRVIDEYPVDIFEERYHEEYQEIVDVVNSYRLILYRREQGRL